jgi:hypothetical protein
VLGVVFWTPFTGRGGRDWRIEPQKKETTARQVVLLENAMTVQIIPKSTQHTGMALSTEGSVAAWQVTFQIDGDDSLHAAVSIPLAGPPTHHEAQQKALKMLQVFLNDACEAAKKYQFSN